MENNADFVTLLSYLGRDVCYVGLKLQQEVRKCLAQLDSTGDTEQYCLKLSKSLSNFSTYINQYAKDLMERIIGGGKDEEYLEAMEILQQLILIREDLNRNSSRRRAQSVQTDEPSSVNPAIEPNAEPSHVDATTEHLHVDPSTEPPHVDPTTEPSHVDPTTEPLHVDPTTEPSYVDPTTELLRVDPITEPSQVTPTIESTSVNPTTEPSGVEPTTETDGNVPTSDSLVKAESDLVLSQCDSLNLGSEGTDEIVTQQSNVSADCVFIDLSKSESSASERSSSTVIYNCSERADDLDESEAKLLEASRLDEVVEDQNLGDRPDNTNKYSAGSSMGDIFEEETVANSPCNLNDVESEPSDNVFDHTTSPSSHNDISVVDEKLKSTDVVTSSETKTEEIVKRMSLRIDESDDSDIIVTSTSSNDRDRSKEATFNSPASPVETLANSPLATPPGDEANSQDSDVTVAGLTQPPRDGGNESDVTVANEIEESTTDFSQVFEATERIGNADKNVSDNYADSDMFTPPKKSDDPTEGDVANNTDKADEGNTDSDVDFDGATQANTTSSRELSGNVVCEDSDVDFDAPTQVNVEISSEPLESGDINADLIGSAGPERAGLDEERQDDPMGLNSEKLEFLKSLAVVPREVLENNGKCDKAAPECPQADKEPGNAVPPEEQTTEQSPSLEGGEMPVPSAVSSSGGSDVFGDVSGSESSFDESKLKSAKKLKDKHKKSIFKLIGEFYLKKKREKMKRCSSEPVDKPSEPVEKPSKPVEKASEPVKNSSKSRAPKKSTKKNSQNEKTQKPDATQKPLEDEQSPAAIESSNSSPKSNQDNMDIHEDSSRDSNNQTTELTNPASAESTPERIIDDHSDNQANNRENLEENVDGTTSKKANPKNGGDSSNEDLDATQKADIRELKSISEGGSEATKKPSPLKKKSNPPLGSSGSSSSDSGSTQVLSPFKRKTVLPLFSTQSEADTDFDDSQVVSPFKKKFVRPLPNTQSEEDHLLESEDEQPTESQFVSPFKRKVVRPLSQSEDELLESEEEPPESQVVSPFRRKVVRPLPCTQSEDDLPPQSSLIDSVADEERKSAKRRLSLGDSDSEPPKKKVERPGEADRETETRADSRLDDSSRDSSGQASGQRSRTDSENSDVSSNLDTNEFDSITDGSLPSPRGLDDEGRDDLLELLEQSNRENRGGSSDSCDDRSVKSNDSDEDEWVEAPSQFKLCDDDRDDLLNLLTDKERDQSKAADVARPEVISQFRLDNHDRDEFLELLNGIKEEEGGSESSHRKTTLETANFKLTDTEKDELLDFLSERVNEIVSSSDVSDDSCSEGEGADVIANSPDGNKEKPKRGNEIPRETLLELVKEFEQACNSQSDASSGQVPLTVNSPLKSQTLTTDTGLDLLESLSNSDKDSDAGSVLLDLLREETIEQSETGKRRPGRPKDHSKEAWKAYKSLLNDRDDDISDSSSSSGSDLGDLETDFSDREKRRATEARNVELRRSFGVDKELVVEVEEADLSGYYDQLGRIGRAGSGDYDRLCDLSNILHKRKRESPHPKHRSRRLRSVTSPSSASSSDDEASDSDSDSDVTMTSDRPASRTIAEDEECERLANALWDDIKNSSDDQSDCSDTSLGGSDDDSDSDTKKKTKKKLVDKGKETGSDRSSATSSSGSSSSESGDEDINKVKKVELDSSDEEDFVGVHKVRGAWRRDPLLQGCIISSDSDSETPPSTKRPNKRKEKKSKKLLGDGTDSDETVVDVDEYGTPVKDPFRSDDKSDDSDFEIIEKQETPQKAIIVTDEEDTPSKSKGRRNIRALLEEEDLAEATQRANNEERERIKRLQERDRAKENFTQTQSVGSQLTDDDPDPFFLDVYEDVQIKVHPKIVEKLKPHQRKGIQFMWDSCYMSLKDIKEGTYVGAAGCILAHCMGLGKTLQALALIQALFSCPATNTKHVLVVCPLSTVLNWKKEYNLAYKDIKHSRVKLYTIESKKKAVNRFEIVTKWRANGGVLVMGYECFWLLINDKKWEKLEKHTAYDKKDILKALVDPGPDLVICDEGHLLRNKQTQRTIALNRVKTKRRIVLTGTPLQNNLIEYYYMVQFVKPNLLGNEKEYRTNFENPILNGQFENSTAEDIMFMKKRAHCLHKILAETVQRVEDTELKRYLPKMIDQAVFVKLSDLQVKLYNQYLDAVSARPLILTKSGQVSHKNFLADVQILMYICLHPNVLAIAGKNSKAKVKIKEQDVIEDNLEEDADVAAKVFSRGDWYKGLITPEEAKRLDTGSKLMVAMGIVQEAMANGDKVLIFSQSYAEMDTLESFMTEHLKFKKDRDYHRMDGTISPEVRTQMCDKFNDKDTTLKVFLMSLKVGGLGLNLTAANRVIVMNVSWNPSWDTQSVFRAFRFGQTKVVYVYRLVAIDTMEEKMYQKVVTKLAVAHRVVDKHQIRRHYTAADIQAFYSVRPSIQTNRPVPNVPEDRVLGNLIQKYQFVYRWHEHQALLANRPEEDLDEQQKNAAWEEYEKKSTEPQMPPNPAGIQAPNQPGVAQPPSAQPGPSGLQNQDVSRPKRPRQPRKRKPKDPPPLTVATMLKQAIPTPQPVQPGDISMEADTIQDINRIIRATTSADQIPVLNTGNGGAFSAGPTGNRDVSASTGGIDELNSIINESLSDSWANDGLNLTLARLHMPELSIEPLNLD